MAERKQLPDVSRRIRAARAYAGFRTRDELARAAGLKPRRLKRLEDGSWLRGEGPQPERPELLAIANACEVPHEFLTDQAGIEALASTLPQDGRGILETLIEQVADVREQVEQIRTARTAPEQPTADRKPAELPELEDTPRPGAPGLSEEAG